MPTCLCLVSSAPGPFPSSGVTYPRTHPDLALPNYHLASHPTLPFTSLPAGDKGGAMLLWDLRSPTHVGTFGAPDPAGHSMCVAAWTAAARQPRIPPVPAPSLQPRLLCPRPLTTPRRLHLLPAAARAPLRCLSPLPEPAGCTCPPAGRTT